jgi:hypothetical protein
VRSFSLLVPHFFGRFFDNEIVSQDADMRTNVVQALGFVAVPGSLCCPEASVSTIPSPTVGSW